MEVQKRGRESGSFKEQKGGKVLQRGERRGERGTSPEGWQGPEHAVPWGAASALALNGRRSPRKALKRLRSHFKTSK